MAMELVLPPRERPVRGDPLTSPRGARNWLEEVRQGGDRESSRRFLEGLQRFNRIELKLDKRLKMAELLRPTARYVIDRLTQRVSTQKLPLDDVSKRNFNALMLLLREAALAYDICAAELMGQRRASSRKLALVVERALYYRGESLLRAAPVHAPVPQNLWHDSNILLHGAVQHRCDRSKVRNDELVDRRHKQTPTDMYTRLVLFALAPTDGLRRGQAERLFQRTESWAQLVPMSDRRPDELSNTLYCVDLARPEGPCPASSTSAENDSMRWMEFAPVLQAAQQTLPTAPPEGSVLEPGQLDAATLQRLIDSWSVHSGRTRQRVVRGELVDVEVSLARIHERLAPDKTPVSDPLTRSGSHIRPRISGSTLALQTIEAPEQKWRQEEDPDEAEAEAEAEAQARAAREREQAERRMAERAVPEQERKWVLVESGGGGFRLRWESSESSVAVVGDLVALHEERRQDKAGRGGRWLLGTIRRIRMIDDHRFDAGVQALGNNPVAARIRKEPANPHRKRDRDAESTEPALLLPAVRANRTPATVLVGTNRFGEGDIVEVDLPGRIVRARLAATRDKSAAFERFRLEKAPSRGRGSGD